MILTKLTNMVTTVSPSEEELLKEEEKFFEERSIVDVDPMVICN